MPRFLLLLSPAYDPSDLSASEIAGRTVRFMAWIATAAREGVVQSGARVTERWAVVTRRAAPAAPDREEPGRHAPERAPCESIAGYFVVEARDLDAATSLASACPAADPGTIRVLELDAEAVVPT